MLRFQRLLGVVPFLFPLAANAPCQAPADGKQTITLKPKAHRTWNLLLPAERYLEVGAGFAVPHAGGQRFAAQTEGAVLKADLDGNGQLEGLVEGEAGFLTLTATSPEKNALSYSVRLVRPRGRPWQYTCGGAMVGELAGTKIQLIDQNLNGSYADVGEDALVVGRDEAASFLSKVVSAGDKLWTIEVARDGASLTATPYSGPSGVLDLQGSQECKAVLQAAVVQSADKQHSFNLAGAKQGLRVPAGSYTLHGGQLVLGDSHAQFRTGRAKAIEVAADGKQVVAWGGPVAAEFGFKREGDEVAFAPREIWYYGRLGEEYFDFMPLGKSPDFVVKDKKTGEVLVNARFPGNC